MTWQDIAITIIMISFSYALIPQIIKGFKKKKTLIALQTSLITSIGMLILIVVYYTLNLRFSTIMATITASLWIILLIQSRIYN